MPHNAIQDVLHTLADGQHLTHDAAIRAFQIIMNGGATPAQMGAFLIGLRMKGETVTEITAGALALRAKAKPFAAPAGTIDTCGTGGDMRGTYNISTAVAFVLAACGMPVAKHGNRSVSSRSGSADVLTVLGVKVDAPISTAEQAMAQLGIAFLFAPQFHPAMRHVAPIRSELAMRTVFNLLGPLCNPAAPDFQLLGVYSTHWLEPMAQVLNKLGTKAAWVVHGQDGMDELSLCGVSHVVELKEGNIRSFSLQPEDAGLATTNIESLRGDTPEHNAKALREAISGVKSPYRDAVLYNAAAALLLSGKATSLQDGVAQAANAIDSGAAYVLLQKLAEISHGFSTTSDMGQR